MKTRIIAFCNQKGGVAKTTTTINVGAALRRAGKRVLLVDADAQGSLSVSVGLDQIESNELTTYELLVNNADAADAIRDNISSGFDVIPADIRLSAADLQLINMPGREYILKDSLKDVMSDYDYILIDCPPSLSLITYNCLTAADEIIIPLQSNYLALNGLSLLLDTIDTIKRRVNRELTISGVVLTMYNGRTKHARGIKEDVAEYFKDKLFNTVIRQNISLADAQEQGVDIYQYDAKSNGAKDYEALTDEIIKQEVKE